MSGCTSGWYKSTFYEGETFSVLQPSKVISCYTTNTTTITTLSPSAEYDDLVTAQRAEMVEITMLGGLFFLFFVMWRSWNKFKLDWFRVIGIYVLGTIGVPVSIILGPSEGGFNQVVGLGILVHNLAELFIIGHIWFGATQNHQTRRSNQLRGIGVIFYVWLIMTLIVFLDQTALFFVLMLQGSLLDWTLVFSFCYLGDWMDSATSAGAKHSKALGCYRHLGIVAAVLHILSIQPLFLGFATTYSVLNLITVILLIPTFIIYICFAAADQHQSPFVIEPNDTDEDALAHQRNRLLLQLMKKENVVELKQRNKGYLSVNQESEDEEQKQEVIGSAITATDDKGDDNKVTTYGDVILGGLYWIDVNGKKWFRIVVGCGVTMAMINSLIVFFAPCYVDVKKWIGCD